jgi:sulfofructose kinase
MRPIVGVGQVVYDLLVSVPELPAWEDTTYVEEYQIQQGGMAATAVVTASRLGAKTEFIGGIGDDLQGEFAKKSFYKDDVICDRMRVFENELTPISMVFIQKSTGMRSFVHNKGVEAKKSLFDVGVDIDLAGVRYILFDGFYPDTILRTAKRARQAGIVSVADISPGTRIPNAAEILSLIDYPIVSEAFIKTYFGTREILKTAEGLFGGDNKAFLVTCGEKGVYLVTNKGSEFLPSFKVPVVDTTGAGDVFHGAFLFSLWKEYPIRDAAVFSNAVAALKCTKIGGQAGIPDFDQTKEFLARNYPAGGAWARP